jgi:regulator of sirC expression with transglutaminase-like and TPR domain
MAAGPDPFAGLAGLTGLAARAMVLGAGGRSVAPALERLERLLALGPPECWPLGLWDDGGPAALNLPHTLETGRGSEICLGILWLEGLRRHRIAAEALVFPARLLLRLGGPQRRVIDPADGGRTLGPPELRALALAGNGSGAALHPGLFEPLSDDAVLLRLQAEVRLRCLRRSDIAAALAAVEGALRIAPDRAKLWREAGLMRLRSGDLPGAAAALEQFVSRTDNVPARGRASQLLAEIRGRMT